MILIIKISNTCVIIKLRTKLFFSSKSLCFTLSTYYTFDTLHTFTTATLFPLKICLIPTAMKFRYKPYFILFSSFKKDLLLTS